ncbi:phenylacetate--CoA ligase family protein [Leucobacter sp. wl10]|uniref:phenylacetate--CoA ligase family protein n=1 Tax=Leucobacter sp. wl10 TaxID=2304677 RepID=UPI000E5BA7E0|nr:phenylacetate--CoA ligase family protein [Leucobacter sp. wl10]RGE16230.1 phenylacetate--CoA ligase family protein [Leucobacter sp. wl10]
MELARAAFTIKSRTLRRRSGRFFDELLLNERLPRERLLALQASRAAGIARFAATSTAYYAETFAEHGVDLTRLEDPAQWQRIPVLERATVKDRNRGFVSSESTRRTARVAKTGGSSGEPLRLQQDARVPTLAHAWRMYRWWGVEPWDHLARVGRWGFGIVDNLKTAVTWWPSKQIYLDAQLFDGSTMGAFHRAIVRTRPALIEGYVGAMLEFADFLEAEGLTIPTPRAVATTAAPLTENARRRLEAVYGTPVYDEYRGSEINWMAAECGERNGLHVFADTRRIEILGPDGRPVPAGTVGDIVVTDLLNRVFPMIRYRVGDRGRIVERECPCGVTLPMIAQPEGRTTDIVRLPSGRMINHGLMAMFADHPEAVRVFQIVQSADYSLRIRVVRGDDPRGEQHIASAVAKVRMRIDDEVPIALEYVDRLPHTGGKTKYLISEVAAPAHDA